MRYCTNECVKTFNKKKTFAYLPTLFFFTYVTGNTTLILLGLIVICIYRPPGHASTAFCDELSDVFDQLIDTKTSSYVICGDFNCPDSDQLLNCRVDDVFTRYNLHQHVNAPTHDSGHVLDLILTPSTEPNLVSDLVVHSVCFSDHHLLSCRIASPRPQLSITSYSYRAIKQIDINAFRRDLSDSPLFDAADMSVDAYADLFDSEMTRLLDTHAPIRHATKRCGKNDCRRLSKEAREAKRHRRRLERRYRRTRNETDRLAYKAACVTARDSITSSRTNEIRTSLAESAGDQRATWRTASKLLHSKPPVYHSDDDCANLANEFSLFFTDKVRRIRESVDAAVKQLPARSFPMR